jgi:NodT family efflux transporter outer membrane factor (OMF) lipoprotein
MKRNHSHVWPSLAIALITWGCVTTPPPEPEEIRSLALGEDRIAKQWAASEEADSVDILQGWLTSFQEPELEALVAEALRNNPNLDIAASRVERSAAFLGIARGALYPTVSVGGQGSTKMGGDLSSGLNGGMLQISWELDIWGRLRYRRNAALESLAALESDYLWARQSLAARVAEGWFLATQTLLEQRSAEEMTKNAGALFELAETRSRIGAGDQRDVAATEASLSIYEDNALKLKLAHENSLRALEQLLGRYPAADIEPLSDLPALPGPVPAGIPLAVLERRPDLIAAERRVAAAFDRIGEAKAARLPTLTLTAGGGYASSEVLELVPDFENPFASVSAGLLAPIFFGGRLNAQVEARNAEQREALAQYSKIALQALFEVENALAAEANLRGREKILELAVAQNERALNLEQTAYRVGSSDLRRVLDQQLAFHTARMSLVRVRGSILTQRVNLFLALGGAFEVAEAQSDTLPTDEKNAPPSSEIP